MTKSARLPLLIVTGLCAAAAAKTFAAATVPYNVQTGVPSNLLATREVYDAAFKKSVIDTLPERTDLRSTHPEFLADATPRNLDFVENARVTVSFVHEGAGYLNVVGVFFYPTANPPASLASIDRVTVFPNASFSGSGGGLTSGDTVDVGLVQPGTSMGFFLNANGFVPGTGATSGAWTVTSRDELNPEANPTLRKHAVLLKDPAQQRFVIAFEDLKRDLAGCDQDFNDVILSVRATPETAIASSAFQTLRGPGDRDGDGVADLKDAYPDDPLRAYRVDSPTAVTDGTLGFEDLWPAKGDFDFNDLVVSWHTTEGRDAGNRIVDLTCRYKVLAAGASGRNGLKVRVPLATSDVAVALLSYDGGPEVATRLDPKEARATVALFEDSSTMIASSAGSPYANTVFGTSQTIGRSVAVRFVLAQARSGSLGEVAPFDTFLFDGGKEVHLPGKRPSASADPRLVRTRDDATDLATGRTYVTASGLPWAISVPGPWSWPSERIAVHLAYRDFVAWAESGGASKADWTSRPQKGAEVWRAR